MTYKRPAYEQVTITQGGNTLTLRPTLRAACKLETRYGFPALYKAMDELNFTIISEIILSASPDRRDAVAFLGGNLERPLSSFFRAVQQPIAELLTMFVPAPDEKAKRTVGTAKPLTWPEIYAALFDRATGWLGWTPDTAWNATPTEIDRAYWAHIEQLKAIHGSSDDKPNDKQISPEQAAHNEAAGLDPEFDRAGLLALKAKIAGAA